MTNQSDVQSKIWPGYSKAAQKLGSVYTFYRPSANSFPGAQFTSMFVSLNAEDMKYGRPNKYGKPTWYALVDGSGLEVGDYFVGALGTFFIAAMQALLPILVVSCNRIASISRVVATSGYGAQGYSGVTPQNESAFVAGVPCSILQGTKGEKGDAGLPGDTRVPWVTILMPASVGTVMYGDLLLDDLGRRFVISSVELTDLGYRMTAAMATV